MVVGLKDRRADVAPHIRGDSFVRWAPADWVAFGMGDILRGVRDGGGFAVDPTTEYYRDRITLSHQSAFGALAVLPRHNTVVTTGLGQVDSWWFHPRSYQGAYWFDTTTGNKTRHELVCAWNEAAPRLGGTTVVDAPSDNEGQPPGSLGDVEVLCRIVPTSTPTAVPTGSPPATSPPPTLTPTTEPSATPEPTATATATVTPTPTVVPTPLYLPLALRERCDTEHKRADIALVIDTSSSMTGQKIVDARQAALLFVSMIDLAPGRSQVAVVRYDREAEVVRELTTGRTAIEAAIRSLHVRSGTHIDKGLRAALAELQSLRHVEQNLPVIVLLTDGLQTGTPGEDLKAAAEVRDAGARLYAIGLGADVDEASLRTMAGDDERYCYAPDSADLASISGAEGVP
jgi:uncharacterized protein YegL